MSPSDQEDLVASTDNRTSFLRNSTDNNATIYAEKPSEWATVCGIVVAFAVIICGVIGNSVTVAAYKRNRKLQTSFNHLITNLCVVDLVFSALAMPIILPPLVVTRNVYPPMLCHFFGYVYTSLMSSSVINLVFIAINRYIGIVHSSKYRFVFSSDLIKWWLVAVWFSSPLLYLPPLVSGAFVWDDSRQECSITSFFSSHAMKTYVIAIYHAVQLFPTIILILLYRAIFKKVKRCRKTVEHYPTPVSCSPSMVDGNEGSHMSRGRFRSLRRQSSINITERESPCLQKMTSSPLSFQKTGQMAYLQVPDAKSSPMFEPKRSSFTSYQGGKPLPFRTEVMKTDHSSLDLLGEDVVTEFKVKENERSTSTSLEDDVLSEPLPRPLLTSERPRRRLIRDMRDWQIMSTIESEPTSKTMSIDRGEDTLEAKSPVGSIKSTEEKNFTNKVTDKHAMRRNTSLGKLSKVDEKVSEQVDVPQITTDFAPCEICAEVSFLVPEVQVNFVVSKETSSKAVDSGSHESKPKSSESIPNIAVSHETKNLSTSNLATACASSLSNKNTTSNLQVSSTMMEEEPHRRHSISTCSTSFLALNKNENENYKDEMKITKQRRSLKRWSWKRAKYNSSPSNPQKSSLETLRGRRIKSEGSQLQLKSWKRTWHKKTNATNIKIVIDQATSEDTLPETIRYFSEMMCDDKLLEEKPEDTTPQLKTESKAKKGQDFCEDTRLTSRAECCRNFISKIKRRHDKRQDENDDSHIAKPNKGKCKKSGNMATARSVESLPSTLPIRKSYLQNSSVPVKKSSNGIQERPKNPVLKDFQSSTNQFMTTSGTSEPVVDQNEAGIYDERRSSITSHIYRYGAEEALSRHGSFSYVSCADDYTRTRNNNRVTSRDCGNVKTDKSPLKGLVRRNSMYISWTRKSFCLSSFNSSATSTESHRRKRRRDAERQLVYNGLIICIALAVCILPLYIIEILEIFTNVYIPPNVTFTAAMLSWLHAVINPAIYGLLNPQYRMEFKRMWQSTRQLCFPCFCCASESPKAVVYTSNMSPVSKVRFPVSGTDKASSRRPSKAG